MQAAQLLVLGPVGTLLTGSPSSGDTSARSTVGIAVAVVMCSHAVKALALEGCGVCDAPEVVKGSDRVGRGGGGCSGLSFTFTRPGGRVEVSVTLRMIFICRGELRTWRSSYSDPGNPSALEEYGCEE